MYYFLSAQSAQRDRQDDFARAMETRRREAYNARDNDYDNDDDDDERCDCGCGCAFDECDDDIINW